MRELAAELQARWGRLEESSRTEMLEEWRNTACDDGDWYAAVYDQCVEENAALGITVDKTSIRFSGFGSQGDGAMFSGEVTDWEKFLTAVGKPELWPLVKDYSLDNDYADELIFQSFFGGGRYCHERSARFRDSLYLRGRWDHDDELLEAVDPLRYAAWDQRTRTGRVLEDCAGALEDFFRDRMKKLYRDLEELHDELTSDTAIIEEILELHTDAELEQKFFRHAV